jgi:hypothetical protein
VAGRIYSTPAAKERKTLVQDDLTPRITCESCHTSKPYKEKGPLGTPSYDTRKGNFTWAKNVKPE